MHRARDILAMHGFFVEVYWFIDCQGKQSVLVLGKEVVVKYLERKVR